MKLIVGLGNPGRIYINSRHNIGFSVVKALSQAHKIALKKESGIVCLSGKGRIASDNVVLALPLTFMNLSGSAVKGLIKKYKIEPGNLLVVCDDLDLEFGRLKIKAKGSSAGQRGLKSIIGELASEDFCRLRVGIGRPFKEEAGISEYVLGPFNKKEKGRLGGIIEEAISCCEIWITKGITESMNIFNRSRKNE